MAKTLTETIAELRSILHEAPRTKWVAITTSRKDPIARDLDKIKGVMSLKGGMKLLLFKAGEEPDEGGPHGRRIVWSGEHELPTKATMMARAALQKLGEAGWGKLDDPSFKFPKVTPREKAGSAVAPTTNRAFKVLGDAAAKAVLDKGFHFASKGTGQFVFPTRPRVAKACGLNKSQLDKLDKADLRVMPSKSNPKYDWYFGD